MNLLFRLLAFALIMNSYSLEAQGFGNKKLTLHFFLVSNHVYTLEEDLDFCLGRMAL